ncbi:MAG: LysM peptidoglycan-binding domain-containing protein [Phycisphaera sp.]|nr:LysM peptidoglycan-binding domain-containing protein [Phycisphaera sp.]
MQRETKIGLLVGTGIILLIGIIVSDHLSMTNNTVEPGRSPQLTEFADRAQDSISPAPGSENRGVGDNRTADGGRNPAVGDSTTGQNAQPLTIGPSTVEQLQTNSPANAQPENTQHNPAPTHPATPTNPNNEFQRAVQMMAAQLASDNGGTLGQTPAPTDNIHNTPANNTGPQPVDGAQQANAAILNQMRGQTTTYLPVDPNGRSVTDGGASLPGTARMTSYKVKANDNLTAIAREHYGSGKYWTDIQKANPRLVGPKGQIREGDTLLLPAKSEVVKVTAPTPATPNNTTPGNTTSTQTDNTPAPLPAGTLVVGPGDTLSSLASQHLGSGDKWDALYQANKDVIKDPDTLVVGMKLKLPATATTQTGSPVTNLNTQRETPRNTTTPTGKTYTVREGDTLYAIAQRTLGNGEKWNEILRANKDTIANPQSIRIGQVIRIPD